MSETDTPETPRDRKHRRVAEMLERQLGRKICGALADPDVIEVMLNPDGQVWTDSLSKGMQRLCSMEAHVAESVIGTAAHLVDTIANSDSPILECRVPDAAPFLGARFEGVMRPVVAAPIFNIRCRALRVFTLVDYVRQGILSPFHATYLAGAIERRNSIIVTGGTGTGKTTFLNALLHHLAHTAPEQRLVVMEDTPELQCSSPNVVTLCTTETANMQRLVKATMRLRPDRIIVGEVRGGEAHALLKAWNTGHKGGLCSLHADTAKSSLSRLEQLVMEAVQGASIKQLIGDAIDVIVSIEKTTEAPGRRIRQILACRGFANGRYALVDITEPEGGLK